MDTGENGAIVVAGDNNDLSSGDCCRYCYYEETPTKPLFYPCHCSGTMRYVHQECLDRWLSHNKRPTCEVCGYKFTFKPIYKEDMPKHLPLKILITGLAQTIFKALSLWFHYTLVAIAWLIVVPLSAYRIYKFIFNTTNGLSSILSLPGSLITPENFASDVFYGVFIVLTSVAAFVALVWLREQIINGVAPEWMDLNLARRPPAGAAGGQAFVNPVVVENVEAVPVQDNQEEAGGNEAEAEEDDELANEEGANANEADEVDRSGDDRDNTATAGGSALGDILIDEPTGSIRENPPLDRNRPTATGTGIDAIGQDDNLPERDEEIEVEEIGQNVNAEEQENANVEQADIDENAANNENNRNEPDDDNVNGGAGAENQGDIFEQAAEELTWDRMLGLDGSLVFLEHVFWVISLNGLFVFLFVYCPFNVGKVICYLSNIHDIMSHLEGFMFLVFGYVAIAFGSLVMYLGSAWLGKKQLSKIFGISYITVKVVLLMFVEIGMFPLLAGLWIDICTLALFDVPWSQRAEGFKTSPITCIFLHWMVGMVFVFYYASFVITLREILRPGVLWFMRNFTDPDFNPVFEMIRLPILSHARRFLLSGTVLGTTCMLALLLPVMTIKYVSPRFLPYQISLVTDAPVSELSMELLLLQLILPTLLDQGHIHNAVRISILLWTKVVGSLLDLRSYLLGANDGPIWDLNIKRRDNNNNNNNGGGGLNHEAAPPPPNNNNNGDAAGNRNNNVLNFNEDIRIANNDLQAAHLALIQVNISDEHQDYRRPSLFPLRILVLLLLTMVTIYLVSCVGLYLPPFLGRQLMSLWFGDLKIHELYTFAIGVYSFWAVTRAALCVFSWVSAGVSMFKERITHFMLLIFKLLVASVFCVGLIPLLLGLFFDILVIMPLRLSADQTPIHFVWQSWALGVLHSKIFCAITVIGPNWWLKTVIDRICRNGLTELDVVYLLRKLVLPVVMVLLNLLALPYFLAFVLLPLLPLHADPLVQNIFYRRFYHVLLCSVMLVMFFVLQAKQMKKLYMKIKNDRYLIGQRLQNYERQTTTTTSSQQL